MGLSKDPDKRAKQLANLKTIQKGEVRNPYGQPIKLYASITGELRQAGADIPRDNRELFGLALMYYSLPESEVKNIVNDKKRTMVERIAAKQVLSKKSDKWLIEIAKRLYGDKLDITTNGKDVVKESIQIEIIDKREQVIINKEEE